MFNPHEKKVPSFQHYNYWTKERPDNFPHPARQCIYSINGTLHNPVCKVVYLDKAEAELWRDKHIDEFMKTGEWFLTPQEAVDAKKGKVKKVKDELKAVDSKLAEK